MSGGATAVMAAAAVAGAAISYQNGQEQKKASQQAKRNALKQEKAADEANNRANQKKADPLAALNAAELSGRGGQSGTMLTGPQGIDPAALNLSKNTLLGS